MKMIIFLNGPAPGSALHKLSYTVSHILLYTVWCRDSWSDEPNYNAMEKLKQLFGVRKNMASLLLCCLSNLDIYFPVGLRLSNYLLIYK